MCNNLIESENNLIDGGAKRNTTINYLQEQETLSSAPVANAAQDWSLSASSVNQRIWRPHREEGGVVWSNLIEIEAKKMTQQSITYENKKHQRAPVVNPRKMEAGCHCLSISDDGRAERREG